MPREGSRLDEEAPYARMPETGAGTFCVTTRGAIRAPERRFRLRLRRAALFGLAPSHAFSYRTTHASLPFQAKKRPDLGSHKEASVLSSCACGLLVRGGMIFVRGRAGEKKRRMAESHAPPLQMVQLFVYLRDHLLLGKNADTDIIKPDPVISSRESVPFVISGNI